MMRIDSRTFLCEHCNTGFVLPQDKEANELHHICQNINGHNVWSYRVKIKEASHAVLGQEETTQTAQINRMAK